MLLLPWFLVLPLAALVAALSADPARGTRRAAGLTAAAGVGAVGTLLVGRGDAFDALVLTLVMGMGATVLGYAARALRDEPYQRRFAVLGTLLVLSTAVTTTADDLVVVALSWVATSALTVAMLRTGSAVGSRPAERARRAFAIGDLALLLAVGMAVWEVGPPVLAAILLVVAATARSASGPFLRWLPDTLSSPTPSSALLHAGVVGSGAIVVIRHGDAIATTPSAAVALSVAALLVGAVTCVVAEAVMVTRPDVKGQLAWSTIAQLSFTLALVGLDLHVAAGLHLVAHGAYKGALFLGSGSSVRRLARARRAPVARPAGAAARATTLGLCLAVAVAVVEWTGAAWTAELALPLALAGVTVWCATGAALARTATAAQRAVVAGVAVGSAAAFTVVTLALKAVVRPEIEVSDPTLSPAPLALLLLGLGMVAATRDRPLPALWRSVEALGSPVRAPRPARPTATREPSPVPADLQPTPATGA